MALQGKTAGNDDPRVYLRVCDEYDAGIIGNLIRDGMRELGYRPCGAVFVKPNVVYATKGGRYGSTAYTDPAVVSAALSVLAEGPDVRRIDMGEKTAIGYPTRLTYRYAGYYELVRRARKKARVPVDIFCIDEERRDRVFVGGKVHDTLRVPRKMNAADSRVYLPKLKCHCVSSMTGAVKLNIGICSDDERSIRHDFLLNDKIVDLLTVGYPDFIVMDAIDVGVGNEAVPTPRRLGLLIMGRNSLAVDLVGARLLGYGLDEVPYLRLAAERGYRPARLADVKLMGDVTTVAGLDQRAKRVMPYDDDFYRWQDIEKELAALGSPLRFFWGPVRPGGERCLTGCVMAAKMFFGFLHRYGGDDAFRMAKASVLVMGCVDGTIDARGQEVFMIGGCSRAEVVNAKKITRIESCTTTAVEMTEVIRGRLGIPTPLFDLSQVVPLVGAMAAASVKKTVNLRYGQDILHFIKRGLLKRI